jgi:3-hydroxyisobutyrate dehydrogenase-like beta-hydroxyacid dehydrogenase
MADLEKKLLAAINDAGSIESMDFAGKQGVDHNAVVGVIKSLEAYDMIIVKVRHADLGHQGASSRHAGGAYTVSDTTRLPYTS